jgi:hypothetical protein
MRNAMRDSLRASVDLNRLNVGLLFGKQALNASSDAAATSTSPTVPAPNTADQQGKGNTRKILSKLFRGGIGKKSSEEATSSPATSEVKRSPVTSLFANAADVQSPTANVTTSSSDMVYYGAPTFGTSPAVMGPIASSGAPVAGSRPVRYTWTIKRWSRQKGGGAGNGWAAGYEPTVEAVDGTSEPGEVIFVWTRGGKSTSSANKRSGSSGELSRKVSRASDVSSSAGHGEPPTTTTTPRRSTGGGSMTLLTPGQASDTRSPSPRASRALSPVPSPAKGGQRDRPVSLSVHEHEEEEDSDPEDSETPWTCTIRIPAGTSVVKGRRGTDALARGKTTSSNKFWRTYGDGLLVATMFPAPHHPRVVAQLKMPLELPTLATGLRMHPAGPAGSADVGGGLGDEIMLTEENVKDCLFVTALWLVAREEFSGLGRKKKA